MYGKNTEQIIEVGVRQGEKTHEILITEEEGIRAREGENMFIIPSNDEDYTELPKLKSEYISKSIEPMTKDEIKEYLKKVLK